MSRRGRLAVILAALAIPACSSSKSAVEVVSSSIADVPATTCATSAADEGRTVTIKVDDLVGGFGGIGSRTPSGLSAGTIRVAIEADAENAGPVDAVLHADSADGAAITTIRGVAAGTTCGVDVDLQAGHYVVTSSLNPGSNAKFDIVAA
jgi:hypothetical protein